MPEPLVTRDETLGGEPVAGNGLGIYWAARTLEHPEDGVEATHYALSAEHAARVARVVAAARAIRTTDCNWKLYAISDLGRALDALDQPPARETPTPRTRAQETP